MKTIEVSDELYEKLERISKEMTSQGHRWTCQPYMFRLSVKSIRPAYDWCWSITIIVKDWEEYFRSNDDSYLKEMVEYIENNFTWADLIDLDLEDEYEVKEFLLKDDFYEYELEEIDEHKWYFLTEESARRHWESNKHHYWKEFTTYLDHCWRNPDMEAVQQFLCELTWWALHK